MRRIPPILTVLVVLACGGPSAVEPVRPAGQASDPGLKPGDAVRVDVWQEEDLTGEFRVSPSGTVVFPLIGEKEVAGKDPAKVEAELVEDYRTYLENPSVTVTALRRIAILGEVRQPNLYMVDATISLTEALAMAGGILPSGNRNDIRLIRNGTVMVQRMDAGQIIPGMPIQSGDQIHVGQRGWASRNLGLVIGTMTSLAVATLYVLYR